MLYHNQALWCFTKIFTSKFRTKILVNMLKSVNLLPMEIESILFLNLMIKDRASIIFKK
jgi:hypothetical protein